MAELKINEDFSNRAKVHAYEVVEKKTWQKESTRKDYSKQMESTRKVHR